MNKKYQLIKDNSVEYKKKTLYRIKALRDFSDVRAGDIGGYVESENNLSHDGDCWLYNKSVALGNSRVYDNAKLYDYSIITGNAKAFENATIKDDAFVRFNAKVHGNASIINKSIISGNADIFGDVVINGDTSICGDAKVY